MVVVVDVLVAFASPLVNKFGCIGGTKFPFLRHSCQAVALLGTRATILLIVASLIAGSLLKPPGASHI